MKFSATALATALVFGATSFSSAFTPAATSLSSRGSFVVGSSSAAAAAAFTPRSAKMPVRAPPSLSMSYTVGIVGATGAVGKEIRECLENRNFPVSKLRIFGSSRSAGSTVESEKYGSVTVELFDRAAARECDVVFLAVSGDFALEHARALIEGDDGCVVIDNSVRVCIVLYCIASFF